MYCLNNWKCLGRLLDSRHNRCIDSNFFYVFNYSTSALTKAKKMRKKIQIVVDMDISYPYLDENENIINQLDLALSSIFSTEEPLIPALFTMEDNRMLDTRVSRKHQGSGSITIQVKRDDVVISKQRFDELADDF